MTENGGAKCSVETITPAIAEMILTAGHPNRPERDWKVDQYADDLRHDRWPLNGSTITLCAKHGGEVDGRHRLRAIIKSGVPMTTFVVRGLTCDIQSTVDQGATRTPGNVFHLAGYSSSNEIAAAARILLRIEMGHEATTNVDQFAPTRSELIDCAERHPLLQDSVRMGDRMRSRLPVPRALATALYCAFREIDQTTADEFFTKLVDGEGLTAGDPVLALRRWLENSRSGSGRVPTAIKHAVIVKSWNAYRRGEVRVLARWKPFDEAFPKAV